MDIRILLGGCVLCVGVAACGGGSSDSTGAGADGPGGSGNGTGMSGSTGAGGGKAYKGYGDVFVNDTTTAIGPGHTSGATASYVAARSTPSPCTITHDSACTVVDCDFTNDQSQAVYVPAGAITITGGKRTITLTTKADNTYTSETSMQSLFSGGETLTFDVAGGTDIPPHSGTAVAPHPITVTAPSFAAMLPVDRTKDFTASWSNGVAGDQVTVGLFSFEVINSLPGREIIVSCTFDGAVGGGTIPSADMSKLLTSTTTVHGSASVSVASATTDVDAGEWKASFSIQGSAAQPSGSPASASAAFY